LEHTSNNASNNTTVFLLEHTSNNASNNTTVFLLEHKQNARQQEVIPH
jgi:hypothetical protein